jgi:preprotein translocase subunit YajC
MRFFGSAKMSWVLFGSSLVSGAAAWAEGTVPAPAGAEGAGGALSAEQPGFGSMLVPTALIFAVFYFLVILPQNRKMKAHQKLLGELKAGDSVVTTSGMIGTVREVADKIVTLEIGDRVKVKFLKSQVSQILQGDQVPDQVAGPQT